MLTMRCQRADNVLAACGQGADDIADGTHSKKPSSGSDLKCGDMKMMA